MITKCKINNFFRTLLKKFIDRLMVFIKTKFVAGNTVTRSFTIQANNLRRESVWERTIWITANFVT
jgi:hypothetical protein